MAPLHPHHAREIVLGLSTPLATETIPLEDAQGRILAAPIHADRDLPPTDRAAMDGYACRAVDAAEGLWLTIVGTVPAGSPSQVEVREGQAVRIFTGAVVPVGADCVVMQELCERAGATVRVKSAPAFGQHILRQGEDARHGDALLAIGTPLDAAQLAVCAMVGASTVEVRQRPTVAVLGTGSELRGAGDVVAAHELRSSNPLALAAMLRDLSSAVVTIQTPVADDLTTLVATLDQLLSTNDLVVTTGGASVGDHDLLPAAIQELGLQLHFDRLQMKPGKPVHCATRSGSMLLALPGSPLAALTACRLLAVAACRTLQGIPDAQGPTIDARLDAWVQNKPGRVRYVPVALRSDPNTSYVWASPVVTHSVADLVAAGRADGALEIPAEFGDLPKETVLPCLLWRRWPR